MNASSTIPRVLVGITTQNRAAILPQAIASALAQSYPAITVAVVDDASTDATPSLAAQHPAVQWIHHATPHGYMANRNDLMRQPGFSYYVSLDDDAWFLRHDEIALAVAHLEAHPELGGVAFDILSPDRPTAIPRTGARPVRMFIGCGHVLRLSHVAAAGYYAPTPGVYGTEEKDLCLRLADLGHGIDLLPGVHVWHDKAWAGRDWAPLHRSGVCNELFMTLRRCPSPDWLVVLPLKILSFAWYWLRHPARMHAGLGGLFDFLRHSGQAWKTRAPVRRATFWNFSKTDPA